MTVAMGEISKEIGVNLTRMSPLHAMFWSMGPIPNMVIDAINAVKGSGYEQEAAQRRLRKIIPIDNNGDLQPSIIVPGSFAIDGLIKGMDDISNGDYGSAFAHSLGFSVKQPEQ
jgi:hypothetical protein